MANPLLQASFPERRDLSKENTSEIPPPLSLKTRDEHEVDFLNSISAVETEPWPQLCEYRMKERQEEKGGDALK